MLAQIMRETYSKKAPKWFKVIKWRQHIDNHRRHWYIYVVCLMVPFYVSFKTCQNPLALQLVLRRPQNEDELMRLKAQFHTNKYQRNWEFGQYLNDLPPPMYDLSQRRKKYPEYYEGRYDGFKRYGV